METGCKPTTPNDYEHLRDRIDAAKILWCTAGGQAVNLWALHYINAHPLIAGLIGCHRWVNNLNHPHKSPVFRKMSPGNSGAWSWAACHGETPSPR
jgi:hypothetical protein